MKPGKELDALVAEKVMGKNHKESNFSNLFPDVPLEYPPYSTDIAAAWEVVEKLKTVLKGEFCISYAANGWTVFRDWHTDSEGLAYANELPHAICLAALRAVGVDV
jgi:hypothetical protein